MFNFLVHYARLQNCALVYFINRVHLVPDGPLDPEVSPAGHPDTKTSRSG